MKVLTLVLWLVMVFVICLCDKGAQRRRPFGLLNRKSQVENKVEEKIDETPSDAEDIGVADGAQERKDEEADSKAGFNSGNSLGDTGYLQSAPHSGTNLQSSMFHDDPEVYNTYMNMLNHYNNYQNKNGTENDEMVKAILKKLLYGVPVFFGYYRVFSYLNEICATGATCSNVTVTTSVTSTKKKSTSFTETSVLTSMKTKTATRTISETSTKPATSVKTTTLPATSTTYRTNTRTLRSTVTTTTTTNTKRTFTFKFSQTTTTVGYSIRTRRTTFTSMNGRHMELFFDDGDDEFIEISPTAGVEITSTYAWSKFSAVMSSLETTTEAEDDEEWTTQETTTPEYDDQHLSQRNLLMPLEGSKSSIVEASSVSFVDY